MELETTREQRELADGLIGAIVFGPVRSRRYGRSLGINVLPAHLKVCNYNCPYCECGWTNRTMRHINRGQVEFPSTEQILEAARRALEACQSEGLHLDAMTLAGNGEPTLHPDFPAVARGLRQLLDQQQPRPKLILLSNATRYGEPEIRAALANFDEYVVKLDAALPDTFRKVNLPCDGLTLDSVMAGWQGLDRMTIQSCFVHGRGDNTGADAVSAWIGQVGQLHPARVQVYSVERPPADARVLPVSRPELESIAAQLEQETGLRAEVY